MRLKKLQNTRVFQMCHDAGFPDLAVHFLQRGLTPVEVHEQLKLAPAIHLLCAQAHLPGLALGFIVDPLTLEEIRRKLIETIHMASEPRSLSPEIAINPQEIYARRNRPAGT
ncbi:MAG: hypothetical protein ACE5JO_02905 [Candidatus Binatia bacterium]